MGTARSPRARRPNPAPRERGHRHRSRLGTGAGGEPAHSGVPRRTECHAHPPLAAAFPNPLGTSGPAQRDPPPTRKGEARATVDDEPHARPPPRGPAEPSPFPQASSPRGGSSGGGGLSASESLRQRYHNAERGGRPGDPVPQGTPLGSLEKAFSPRVGHTPHPPVAPRRAHRGARGHLGKGGGVWREEQEPAATLSVHGQGRGPAGARAHSPRRPPAVHPPPCCEVKHLQRTHTRPVGGRTAAPRRPAGARVAGPSPPRPLTRPALTRQRGGTGRALAGPGGALPRVGRGASHSTASAHTQRTPSGPTRRHRGGDRRRGRWGWERHTTAQPRAPEGQPGALQEHRKGPGRASARATPERAARRAGGTAPPPPRRGAAREATTTRGESKGCLLRQRTPPTPAERHEADSGGGRARSGRVPHPSASQRTAHRRGRETGGPPRAGREERVPFTMNGRPSPAAARSRPGRARHHHIDQGKQPRSGVGQSATASPEASEQISLTTPRSREGAADNPGRDEERLTRTARSQREWGCHGRPRCPQQGAHSGRVSPRRLPRRPRVGQRPGPKAAPGVGTLRRTRDQAHTGPSRRLQHEQGRLAGSPGGPEAHRASRGPTSPATSRQRTACQQ